MSIKTITFDDFNKGLVSNVTNEALDNKELPLIKNFDYDNRGALIRRLGYKNIMPSDPTFDGSQQGYIQFIARPYRINSYEQLFKFNEQSVPRETDGEQETRLLAVDGVLKLVENNITGIGDIDNPTIFVPEEQGWERVISFSSNDTLVIENDAFGKLIINVFSSAVI